MSDADQDPRTGPGSAVNAVDLVVLAGGHGSRLGGQDKAALVIGGRSLLDRLLHDVDPGGRIVVVTSAELPGDVPHPERTTRTLEDPPDGGPAAGIAAGLTALGEHATPWVAVVAVDQPAAAQALHTLLVALPGAPGDAEALSHVDTDGHRQWLLALYRRAALRSALDALPDARDVSVGRLVSGLVWHEVGDGAEHLGDVDTWDDAEDWALRVAHDDVAGSC